jgi:glyoxylase-like metal-dependent hydrolase (beta-lactamase superfamily II)
LDHVGWNVLSEGGRTRATFPRARYHVQRADWDAFSTGGDANDRAAFEAVVRPLEELGCLELVDGDQPLTAALGLLHTPGHTPGSQSLTVMSNGEQALLWGDVATHPAQITEPSWSGTDVDPGMATATRESLFARIEAEGFIAAPAHFPEPFGSIVRLEGRRWWRALRAEDQ